MARKITNPRPIVGRAHHAAHSRRAALYRRAAPSRWQLRLVMCSICMRYRQLLLVGQLSLEGSSESASQRIITSGQRDTLSEAVVSLKTVVTFVTWLISRTEFSSSEINHVTNVTTVLNETTASDRVSCLWQCVLCVAVCCSVLQCVAVCCSVLKQVVT